MPLDSSADSENFVVTHFYDQQASGKSEFTGSLARLANDIKRSLQKRKTDLPWLKLARFGDLGTNKGCLRHDGNVLAITGIEGDYDSKPDANGLPVTIEDATALIRSAGIEALFYSTPSSTPECPRWRVLAPLSREYPGDESTLRGLRCRFLARLNGVLGGVLAPESFDLSRAYYFGNIDGQPDIAIKLSAGCYRIDQADSLDARAIYKNGANQPEERASKVCNVTDIPLDRLREKLSWINPRCSYEWWQKILAAIEASGGDADLALCWSAGKFDHFNRGQPANYCGDDFDMTGKLASFRADKPGGAGYGTLCDLAHKAEHEAMSPAADVFGGGEALGSPLDRGNGVGSYGDDTPDATSPSAGSAGAGLRELTWTEMRQRAAAEKPKEYLWAGRLLRDEPNLWTGDGGIGKTTLAENAAVAIVHGISLLGHPTVKAPVLLIVAEDRYKEVLANIDQIAAERGVVPSDDLRVLSTHSEECDGRFWFINDDGNVIDGDFWPNVEAALRRLPRGGLAILDPLAEFIHFDHNSDKAARACARRLARLCQERGITVVVTDHPSKASMASGEHYGGSREMKAAFALFATLRLTDPHDRGIDGQKALTFEVIKSRYSGPSETSFYRVGDNAAYKLDPTPGQTPEDIKRRVLAHVIERVTNGNGKTVSRDSRGGYGPRDIAFALSLKERAVKTTLRALEADDVLAYLPASNHGKASYMPGRNYMAASVD